MVTHPLLCFFHQLCSRRATTLFAQSPVGGFGAALERVFFSNGNGAFEGRCDVVIRPTTPRRGAGAQQGRKQVSVAAV